MQLDIQQVCMLVRWYYSIEMTLILMREKVLFW